MKGFRIGGYKQENLTGKLLLQSFSLHLPVIMTPTFFRQIDTPDDLTSKDTRIFEGIFRKTVQDFGFSSYFRNRTVIIRNTAEDKEESDSNLEVETRVSAPTTWLMRPAITHTIDCENGKSCQLSELKTEGEITRTSHSIDVEYAMLPHHLGVGASIGNQKTSFSSQIKYVFPGDPPLSRFPWAKAVRQQGGLMETSMLNLEWINGDWTYFASLSDQILSPRRGSPAGQIGTRYEGRTLYAAATIIRSATVDRDPVQKTGPDFGWAIEIRAFLDRNISRAIKALKKRPIEVSVVSNALGIPIAGADIRLERDGSPIYQAFSDKNGRATFSVPSCCEDFVTRVYKDGLMQERRTGYVDGKFIDNAKFILNDHVKYTIIFKNRGANGVRELQQSELQNFIPELGESIVTVDGAKYEGNQLFVATGMPAKVQIKKSLLPFRYEILKIEGLDSNEQLVPGDQNTTITVTIKDKREFQ